MATLEALSFLKTVNCLYWDTFANTYLAHSHRHIRKSLEVVVTLTLLLTLLQFADEQNNFAICVLRWLFLLLCDHLKYLHHFSAINTTLCCTREKALLGIYYAGWIGLILITGFSTNHSLLTCMTASLIFFFFSNTTYLYNVCPCLSKVCIAFWKQLFSLLSILYL